MDPWPTQRKEPKAPDKNIEALNPKDSNIIMKIKSDTPYSTLGKNDSYSPRVVPTNKDSSVSSLNEPDLKALLEEAMAYKRPKDIQGKSDLFKELLQSVECDKKYSVLSRPEKQGTRRPRRKQMNKKEIDKTTNEGHFQDLIVHVSECEVSSNRSLKYAVKCSSGNTAQVVPVNAVTVCDENNPEVAALLQNGSFDNLEQIQQFIANEANVYQIKEPVDNRVGFPLTINPYVEKTPEEGEARISVKDISTLTASPKENPELSGKESLSDSKKSLDENGNAVGTSRMDSLAERKAKARRLKAKNDKNTILSQHIEGHRSDISEDIDALMQYIESPKTNDTKSARQRNSVGYSKQGSRIGNKIAPVRDKSSDTLSRKEQKTKETQIQKSSSLEEVSISKFEDLTQSCISEDKTKLNKKSTNDKSHWKSSMSSKSDKDSRMSEGNVPARSDKYEQELFDTDFLPVTKKNRKKKNIYENNFRNKSHKTSDNHRSDKVLGAYIRKSQELDGFHAPSREFQRRKSISSVPSSDKSGDTSDMDSVHSFPVSSSKGKGMKGNVSVSSGSTPQISYADIARSVPSPTRNELSPKCKVNIDNFGDYEDNYQFSPQEPIPTVVFQLPPRKEPVESSSKSHEEYPPLENKTSEKDSSQSEMFVEYTVVVPKRISSTTESNSINVEETVLIEMPPTKRDLTASESINVAVDNRLPTKRPPVILMHSNTNDSNDVNDLVFGFEVNEQLLISSESLKNSDIVFNEPIEDQIRTSNVLVDQGNCESAKDVHLENSDSESIIPSPLHLELVDFISSEWQAVQEELSDGSGRVLYYSP